MSHHYLDNLGREVNERLQQRGTIAVPSLTKEYDLPADFLLEQVGSLQIDLVFFLDREASDSGSGL